MRLPQTPEEALRTIKSIEVPTELYLMWINRLAPVPSQFGGAVYAGMEQVLAEAINAVAERQVAS